MQKIRGKPMLQEENNIKIIRADITHLNLLAPLFNGYRIFYEYPSDLIKASDFIRERLTNKDSIILIATDMTESNCYGFTQLYPSFTSLGAGKIFILNDLYIDQEHRKNGIARQLMSFVKNYAIKNGYIKIVLQTAIDNEKAQALYVSEGYKKSSGKFVTYSLDINNNS